MTPYVPAEVLGWTLSNSSVTYDRESIFTYINGAGEVFLAYDFRDVHVAQYTRPDYGDIKAELFDMGSPAEAYGVFSHSRDTEETGIGRGYEYRGRLLCFWQNRYFVCVSSTGRAPELEQAILLLARGISDRLPKGGEKPAHLSVLPDLDLIEGTVRYFHNHTSLNVHYYLSAENILGLGRETDCVLGRYAADSAVLLCIAYPDSDAAARGYRQLAGTYAPGLERQGVIQAEGGRFVAGLQRGRYMALALEAADAERARALVDACGNRLPPQEGNP